MDRLEISKNKIILGREIMKRSFKEIKFFIKKKIKLVIIGISILLMFFFINLGSRYIIHGYVNIDTKLELYNLISNSSEEVSTIINGVDNKVKLKIKFDNNYIFKIEEGDLLKVKGDVEIVPLSDSKYDASITEYIPVIYQISQNIPKVFLMLIKLMINPLIECQII